MANYTITSVNANNVAKITFSDDSWTFVQLYSDTTEADLDDLILRVLPPHLRTGNGTPSFVTAGASRTAAEKPTPADPRPAWEIARQVAYGSAEQQIEFITENGLEAWQTRVAEIKANNPKT